MSEIGVVARERCRGCGAEFKDLVCEYCGLASRRAEDPALERAALDELHVLLRRCEPDAQAKLLREGFLPASAENLLEAAVACLVYLELGSSVDPTPGAVKRLEAIVAKLRALPVSEAVGRALEHYEARLAEHRRAERTGLIGGLTLFGGLALAVLAAIVWLVLRLTG